MAVSFLNCALTSGSKKGVSLIKYSEKQAHMHATVLSIGTENRHKPPLSFQLRPLGHQPQNMVSQGDHTDTSSALQYIQHLQ